MKHKYKILLFTIFAVVLASTVSVYIQHVNSEYQLKVYHKDNLENVKDISNNESLLKDYNLSHMLNGAETFKKTGKPVDELNTISILTYNEAQELISILDELSPDAETIKNHRIYNITFDGKHFEIQIANCGGQCAPYD